MKCFIVIQTFGLNSPNIYYLQGKIYKENELQTGWLSGGGELSYLQSNGYIEIIQDIHSLVKTVLLKQTKIRG